MRRKGNAVRVPKWMNADNWTNNKGHNKRLETLQRQRGTLHQLKAKISTTLPCILDNHDLTEGVQKRRRRADITNRKSKNTKNSQRSPTAQKKKVVKDSDLGHLVFSAGCISVFVPKQCM